MIRRSLAKQLLASLLGGLVMLSATAQDFPNKGVTVMVPYPAGGPSDAVARLVQTEYEKFLGQKMLVENLGGVSGALGIQKVLAAPADGYFQLLATPMELVMAPLALSAVKFKPEELRLASLLGRTSIGLAVRKDIPVKNTQEFIEWAKGKKISYASVGQGSLYHIMGERFKTLTKLDLLHVPYRAATQIYTDLGGNNVDMAFVPIAGPIIGMARDNRFKIIGITAPTAHPQLPEAPPINALPGMSDFLFDIWIGLQVPKGTPEPAVQKLNQAMNEAIKSETFVKGMTTTGSQVPSGMSLAELDRFYNQEVVRYRALFKAAGVEPQ
jgi:tripartite-type tricarboxylate transporter receptor subunit TctC